MLMFRFLPVIILLVAGSACPNPAPTPEVADLRLTQEGDNFPVLSGVLVNTSEQPVSTADISVELLDANNMPLEDAEVRIQLQDIPPGDSAFFRRPLDLYPAGARVTSVVTN